MKIDDLIYELLEEPVVQEDDSIVFTSRSIELIHKIAYAPTSIHMRIAPKMLIPIISQKLKERGI